MNIRPVRFIPAPCRITNLWHKTPPGPLVSSFDGWCGNGMRRAGYTLTDVNAASRQKTAPEACVPLSAKDTNEYYHIVYNLIVVIVWWKYRFNRYQTPVVEKFHARVPAREDSGGCDPPGYRTKIVLKNSLIAAFYQSLRLFIHIRFENMKTDYVRRS